MGQRRIVQSTSGWYLIASDGDMVLRVRPGMQLGETAAGELSFDSSNAQLELDIADDGGLVVSAVGNHELEPTAGRRRRREQVGRHRRAQIRLGHNVLLLNTDFVDPAQADETVEINAVRLPEDVTQPEIERVPDELPGDRADATVAPRPPRRSTSRSPLADPASAADEPLPEPRPRTPLPLRAPRPPGPQEPTVGDRWAQRRDERAGPPRQRDFGLTTVALIALAVLGLALLYPTLREEPVPESSATAGADPAPEAVAEIPEPGADTLPSADVRSAEPVPSAVAEASGPGTETSPSVVPNPPTSTSVAPPAAEPEVLEEVAERPGGRLPEPAPVAAPAIEPVVVPPVERRLVPRMAQTVGPAEAAAPEAIDPPPDPAVVAELEEIGETARALAAELARRRDLLAADLALAQGRLMAPPETSAYALYSRVLALDPGSSEARSGLQSVRQGLINRALAQLAGGALEDARTSLQAAADAGANPMLIADLNREVDYRQSLIDAQAE